MKNNENISNNLIGRKIIICTSFREFNGNSNDRIQRLFLESIRNQTYQNYILSATTFGEKNVGRALDEEKIPHLIFEGRPGDFRFSLTQVIQDAISIIDENNKYIFIWTTCDVVFENNFFEEIVKQIKPGYCGTSYPHILYKDIRDYKNKNNSWYLWGGIDTIFYDADLLTSDKAKNSIANYLNNDWGYFEFFLTAVGMVFSNHMINIWPNSIKKITNDYTASNQNYKNAKASCIKNFTELKRFTKEFGLENNLYEWILKYKIKDNSFPSSLMKLRIFVTIKYYSSQFKQMIIRIKITCKNLLKLR